jgi:hypothetical protein
MMVGILCLTPNPGICFGGKAEVPLFVLVLLGVARAVIHRNVESGPLSLRLRNDSSEAEDFSMLPALELLSRQR